MTFAIAVDVRPFKAILFLDVGLLYRNVTAIHLGALCKTIMRRGHVLSAGEEKAM